MKILLVGMIAPVGWELRRDWAPPSKAATAYL